MSLLFLHHKLNDSINDTVDESRCRLFRLHFQFLAYKTSGWKILFRHIAPFLLSVSILDWSTNIIPTRPQEQGIKVKFVKPVKTTIGTKSVLRLRSTMETELYRSFRSCIWYWQNFNFYRICKNEVRKLLLYGCHLEH